MAAAVAGPRGPAMGNLRAPYDLRDPAAPALEAGPRGTPAGGSGHSAPGSPVIQREREKR
jgi:hypothetical protein